MLMNCIVTPVIAPLSLLHRGPQSGHSCYITPSYGKESENDQLRSFKINSPLQESENEDGLGTLDAQVFCATGHPTTNISCIP